MKKLNSEVTPGLYITRDMSIVEIKTINIHTDMGDTYWPATGYFRYHSEKEGIKPYSWTLFGAYSDKVVNDYQYDEDTSHEYDLLKKISIQTHPEYFI